MLCSCPIFLFLSPLIFYCSLNSLCYAGVKITLHTLQQILLVMNDHNLCWYKSFVPIIKTRVSSCLKVIKPLYAQSEWHRHWRCWHLTHSAGMPTIRNLLPTREKVTQLYQGNGCTEQMEIKEQQRCHGDGGNSGVRTLNFTFSVPLVSGRSIFTFSDFERIFYASTEVQVRGERSCVSLGELILSRRSRDEHFVVSR